MTKCVERKEVFSCPAFTITIQRRHSQLTNAPFPLLTLEQLALHDIGLHIIQGAGPVSMAQMNRAGWLKHFSKT